MNVTFSGTKKKMEGQKNFADRIKLRISKWEDYPGLSGWGLNEIIYILLRRRGFPVLALVVKKPLAHWVAYQQKPFSEPRMSSWQCGTKWSWNAPKVWSDFWPQGGPVDYKLALAKCIAKNWAPRTLAICVCRGWTLHRCSCWPSTPPRGFRVEWGILCSSEFSGTGLEAAECFQEQVIWSQSLHLLISREALNPFMVSSDPCE